MTLIRQADFKESTVELYAHGGVGFVVDVLTDNSNRAAADIRNVASKKQLKLAEPGSVAFNFDRVGQVTVEADKPEDEVMEAALEAGAQDLEAAEAEEKGSRGGFRVFTAPGDLMACTDALRAAGLDAKDARFVWRPKAPVEVDEAVAEANAEAAEALEALDDVDAVFTNMA
mmetsp:Transcript_29949/g.78912  ORF Transcript_29949/g.78912 Transcript_29949/m.78912 type:complete len:172 (+) Transcript_29949:461-976(+)